IDDLGPLYRDLDEWLHYYLRKRTKLGIRCEHLSHGDEAGHRSRADDEKYIRKSRFLPADCDLGGDITIYDNKVGIFSYEREHPVGIIIEDETISHMMKKLFDFMWQLCKE